jgi:hypothetical protein
MVQDGGDDGEHDDLLDADDHHRGGGQHGHDELVGTMAMSHSPPCSSECSTPGDAGASP